MVDRDVFALMRWLFVGCGCVAVILIARFLVSRLRGRRSSPAAAAAGTAILIVGFLVLQCMGLGALPALVGSIALGVLVLGGRWLLQGQDERGAEERRELEAQARKEWEGERQAEVERVEALKTAGHIVDAPRLADEWVTCSNGHKYVFRDFRITESHTETDFETYEVPSRWSDSGYSRRDRPVYYEASSSKVGCPLCKSTQFRFDRGECDAIYRAYKVCRTCCFWHRRGSSCPVCRR